MSTRPIRRPCVVCARSLSPRTRWLVGDLWLCRGCLLDFHHGDAVIISEPLQLELDFDVPDWLALELDAFDWSHGEARAS